MNKTSNSLLVKGVYLISPFTADDELTQHRRQISNTAAIMPIVKRLSYKGILASVFSPVGLYPLAAAFDPDCLSYADWMRICMHQLDLQDIAVLLPLEGWDKSSGVAAELGHVYTYQKPLYVLERFSSPYPIPLDLRQDVLESHLSHHTNWGML